MLTGLMEAKKAIETKSTIEEAKRVVQDLIDSELEMFEKVLQLEELELAGIV